MTPTRRAVLRAGGGVLAGGLLAGCVDDSSGGGGGPDTMATAESTPSGPWTVTGRADNSTTRSTETQESTSSETTPGTTRANRGCNGARALAFKPRGGGGIRWDRQSVLVSYSLGPNAHILLVAYEGDTIRGMRERHSPGVGSVTDLDSIRLDEPLTGEHTIRVVMYADPDGDGKFDPASATPCRYESEVVQAGPETIDFSRFPAGTSTTEMG